jgi:hypothetical protein
MLASLVSLATSYAPSVSPRPPRFGNLAPTGADINQALVAYCIIVFTIALVYGGVWFFWHRKARRRAS